MSRSVLVCILCLASGAVHAAQVRIAIHPVVGVDDKRLAAELDDQIRNILVETDRVLPVSQVDMNAALPDRGGRRICPWEREARTKCLEKAAGFNGATYALFVELRQLGSLHEISGLLVAANRTALEQPKSVTVSTLSKPALLTAIRTLLLENLKLRKVTADPSAMAKLLAPEIAEPTPVVSQPTLQPIETPPPQPPLVTTPPMQDESKRPVRIAAWVAGGVAVGALAAAIGLSASASADASTLLRSAQSRGQTAPPYTLAEADVPIEQARQAKATASAALFAGGAAAAATSVVLFVVSREAKTTVSSVAAQPIPGGAMVAIQGRF